MTFFQNPQTVWFLSHAKPGVVRILFILSALQCFQRYVKFNLAFALSLSLWQRRTHRSLLERAFASLPLSWWKQQEMLLTYHRLWQCSLRLGWKLRMGVQPFRLRSLFITCSAGCWFREVHSLFCLQERIVFSMFHSCNLVPSSLWLFMVLVRDSFTDTHMQHAHLVEIWQDRITSRDAIEHNVAISKQGEATTGKWYVQ